MADFSSDPVRYLPLRSSSVFSLAVNASSPCWASCQFCRALSGNASVVNAFCNPLTNVVVCDSSGHRVTNCCANDAAYSLDHRGDRSCKRPIALALRQLCSASAPSNLKIASTWTIALATASAAMASPVHIRRRAYE